MSLLNPPSAASAGPWVGTPDSFSALLERAIDARIAQRWRGQHDKRCDGIPDAVLVLELIARGFAVHKPLDNK